MSSALSFLKTAKVEEATVAPRKPGGGRTKQWNPSPILHAIRLWKDGSVFPSRALVDAYDLEYKEAAITKIEIPLKEGQTEQKYKNEYFYISGPGNGFDVIDSRAWASYNAEGHMLFISPVQRDEPKVSLFSSVGYDAETGKPKNSVMDQGSSTYGKDTLLDAVKEIYGIELNDEKEYVDLIVFTKYGDVNITEAFSKPLTFLPKTVVSGKDKGQPDLQRRENAKIYGFVPLEILNAQVEDEDPVDTDEE